MAIGLLLVCWRIAPEAGDDWQLWLLTGAFAAGGTAEIIRYVSMNARARGPRPARKTPPPWLVAWLIVGVMVWSFGTPHLRIVYGPRGCFYAGWNGWEQHGRTPCPLIALLPLKTET